MNANTRMPRIKARLCTLFRPGIGRDIASTFVLLGILGLVAGMAVQFELQKYSELNSLLEATGRLRTLSQRIALTAQHAAAQDDAAARSLLPQLSNEFEEDLRYLEATPARREIFDQSPAQKPFVRMKAAWQPSREALNALQKTAPGSPAAQAHARIIDRNSDEIHAAAEATLGYITPRFTDTRSHLQMLTPAAALLGCLLTSAMYLYVRRRLLKPIKEIIAISHRFANGDMNARIAYQSHDEIGHLASTLNRAAEALHTLLNKHARAAQALRDSELMNRTLWETVADAIIIVDEKNIIQFANPAVSHIFGFPPEELLGQDATIVQPVHLREVHRENLAIYLASRDAQAGPHDSDWRTLETLALHRSGREIPVELTFSRVRISTEDWYVGFFRDITQRQHDQSALHLRERAIESSRDGIMITDAQTTNHPILYVNPAIERISGYKPEEVIGHSGRVFLGKELDQPEAEALRELLRQGDEGGVILSCYRKDGVRFWNELTVSPVRDDNGFVSHYISIFKDITVRKQQEAALVKSANFDALTELPNRVLLLDRLQQAISSGTRHTRKLGLLFVNLDHFKVINDSLGHDVGNQLIVATAKRLSTCLWSGDTLARIGGDEFVFLLDELNREETLTLVARRILEAFKQPIEIGGHEIVISASIGASIFPRDGDTAATLLQCANLAMRRAKEHGRNHLEYYTEEMHSHVNTRLTIETQLRKAIEREEFVLHFQPQVRLESGRVVGAEALIRWQHPELGLLPPSRFIAIAEETGLIVPIGEWVLHKACSEAKRWLGLYADPVMVAVNLSARQFRQSKLLDVVYHTLSTHGLQPSQLELEITESLVMHDPGKTTQLLRQMKEMGLHISLDDFGTGYSSLAYLKNFPVDRLKIDKSFIQDVAIVRAVIQLARSFNLETVAEGVEDKDVLHLLRHLNCDIVQGYYFAHPMAADTFAQWLLTSTCAGQPAASSPPIQS
ncbi:MAG: EAL domain-containing protein [Sterolibacterium sp.]|jgi:diguanylate cyclase (GGDEF)-like protein/PAS domain S-box-containing protein|nr:EAL domain-containing protein [Sterolibacterium sp.]